MKILTFLGTGNYQQANYTWGENREYATHLFPEALVHWLQPKEMLVFLTQEARECRHNHWPTLQERLTGKVHLTPVDIPSGKSEQELWQIFQVLADSLQEKEEVVFDVTHAFRSLPILSLLAAAYLRVAKQVRLSAILYGAFEAKDDANHAPVFDLTPFVGLLDWVTATDRFLRFGHATDLADLLRDAHLLPWRLAAPQSREGLPRHLRNVADKFRDLTQALMLARPPEIAQHASTAARQLPTAAPEMARFAQPFVLLLERASNHVSSLLADDLDTQRQLIHWYVEHGHAMQALSLAREWLVSWVCCSLKLDLFKERKEAEDLLKYLWRRDRGFSINGEPPRLLAQLDGLPQTKDLLYFTRLKLTRLQRSESSVLRVYPLSLYVFLGDC